MGNVYFTVRDLNSVFKLDRTGLLTRVAGFSTAGFSGDGGPATSARLLLAFQGDGWPAVMADAAGNLFIADVGNHRIRRVSPDGTINTVAGNGTAGFSEMADQQRAHHCNGRADWLSTVRVTC